MLGLPAIVGLQIASRTCISTPADINLGCRAWWTRPSCPPTHDLVTGPSCGWWGAYRTTVCRGKPACCAGWQSPPTCDTPLCPGGCGPGSCVAPGLCECPAGSSGPDCRTAADLRVLSVNFACRDVGQFRGCDNCATRFALIARAIGGTEPEAFPGFPDLEGVDVILAQELGTHPDNFAAVTGALRDRGFVHSSGSPGPTAADPQCADAPGPMFDLGTKQAFSALSGLDSGGLVTFSRHPIQRTVKQNWCAHNLPAPAGYVATLLDVAGTAAVVVNAHFFPEYDFGITAADVRTYQFSELSAFADGLAASLRSTGAPYAVVLGGDFNEDMYGLNLKTSGVDCGALTGDRRVRDKLRSVGLDLAAACGTTVGTPTWDPTLNDLAARFSSSGTHEVLDYLVLKAWSSSAAPQTPVNAVSVLRTAERWSGTFCESSTLGTLGKSGPGTASALTDHNAVAATFHLPEGGSASSAAAAAAAFDAAAAKWRSRAGAEEAACGQSGTLCGVDANCCSAASSWSGVEQHCDSFQCKACVPIGGSCGLQLEGSACCGFDDYSGGAEGAHCEWGTCVRKFAAGARCTYDSECQSKQCEWKWSWFSSGFRCK